MKKATTKILLAALSLVMAIGIATGSTFAWFTANRTVQVGSIDATVTSGTQGMYVAVYDNSASNYSAFQTAWTGTEISTKVFGATPTGSVLLDALTSSDNGVTLTRENSQTGVTFNAAAQNNPFLEITLKFRTTTAQDIYLGYNGTDANSTITAGTGNLTAVKAWRSIEANEYGNAAAIAANATLDTRAAYATRVAFHNTDSQQTNTRLIWAPYDYTTGNNDGYNTQAGFYVATAEKNLARDYRNALLGTADAYTIASTNAVKLESDADAQTNTITTGATKIATTEDNGAGAFDAVVTIRIWIEGTDGDCLNTIYNDTIAVNLVFNSLPHTNA